MKNLKMFNRIKIVFILFFPGLIFAKSDTLNIDKCIEIALRNNPQIKIAESNLDLADANLVNNRSTLYPQLSFNSGWTRNGGNFFQGPTSREANYSNYTYGFQANQLIYDFGKTYSKISGTSELQKSSAQDLLTAKQTIIINTYAAYFNYLSAVRLKEANKETLTQALEHLDQAEKFFAAGKKPQFDVMKAKTDVANAKVTLINAENTVVVNKLQLENVLNIKLEPDFCLKDNLEVIQDSIPLEKSLEIARENRPELISAKYKIEANKAFVSSAWMANLPSINMTGGYNWKTFDIKKSFLDSWNLGVTFSLPLFAGFGLEAQTDLAKANLKNSEAQYEYVDQSVLLDVQQQYYSLNLASSKIEATKLLVEQSKETLNIAEARYQQEVGSPIEITDARVTMLNAQVSYIQALYDYQVTAVKLKKAMGIIK